MSGPVAAVANEAPGCCHVTHCDKDRCRISLKGAPSRRVIVDMDCAALSIPSARKRCDYLFVGEGGDATLVAPIELKSGRFNASAVLEQLEGGIMAAERWLPKEVRFRLIPILAHGKGIRRENLKALRSRKLKLRGQSKRTELIKCGDALTKALRL